MPKIPTEKQFETFLAGPPGVPVVMLNVLNFSKDGAGVEAYSEYGMKAAKLIEEVGGSVIYQAQVDSVLIGDEAMVFHAVALVKYPSREAFLKMVDSDAYRAIAPLREEGLESQWLIATTPLQGIFSSAS